LCKGLSPPFVLSTNSGLEWTAANPPSPILAYAAKVAPPVSPRQAIKPITIPTTAAAVRDAATRVTVSITAQTWWTVVQFPEEALQETKLQSLLPFESKVHDFVAKPQPWKSKHWAMEHWSSGLDGHILSVDEQPVGFVVLSALVLQVLILQGLESTQKESSAVKVQFPVVGSHVSVVQESPSSHWASASKRQAPARQ
jgi:hypothetical protein